MTFDRVDYTSLDTAKNAFIAASRKTLSFAKEFGFVPDERLGASANVFQLDLGPFLKANAKQLYVTLVPEGLGTADDARPDDLTSDQLTHFWHNIGIKTVAVMTNDAASSGMQPILISLYLPSAEPQHVFTPEFMKGFLEGFVAGCRTVKCVYFSGETPQLKTKIVSGRLDIAGALFGLMPPGVSPITSNNLKAGNKIVFIGSSGPHENGFTTLRSLAEKLPQGYHTKLPSGQEYWEAINAPSVLYTPLIQAVLKAGIHPTNIEPISGHGWQKLMRPSQAFSYVIENMLPAPEIFQFVQKESGMTAKQIIETFNYGVGYAIFVEDQWQAEKIVALAEQQGISAKVAGYVEKSEDRKIIVEPLAITLNDANFSLKK